jgi:hypothetical protein
VKPERGLYWHVHHDVLFEYCYDAEERLEYIRANKPESEIETRLRLMRPIVGTLGDPVLWTKYDKACDGCKKASDERNKAWAEYDKAWAEYAKASDERAKARAEYDKAWAEYDKAWAEYNKALDSWYRSVKPGEVEALHAIECPNCPWNGKTIFPKGGGK